jgi:peptidoglycan/xylan/chitin deacetylase (PgdA/CDA1 family)
VKAILTYHSVDDSGSPISIAEPAFRRHVAWLAAHGPAVVSVPELLCLPVHEAAVALTFDDAYQNFGDVAWPVLRDHGLRATLYVPTSHVGRTNAWGGRSQVGIPTLPLLDWERLGRLAEEGVQLGSHTCTHPHLTRLAPTEMRDELEQSAASLERLLGRRPAGLAYPYGAHDAAVIAAAASLYDHAVTVELRTLGPVNQRHRLPRVDAYYLRGNDLLAAWGTQRLKLYLSARASVRRCRTLLSSARLA